MASYNDQQFIEWRKVWTPGTSGYDDGLEEFNKYKEIAKSLSKLSGEELAAAAKNYSDEELMRSYYCSKAFQDRVFKMFGYKNGDYIPEKDYAAIKNTISNGIKQAVFGQVKYWEGGEEGTRAGWHRMGRSYVYTAFIEPMAKTGCSLVGHEMSHSLYNTDGGISPGFNSYYEEDSLKKTYGKKDAPINLLGTEGDNRTHDSSGVEQGAYSSGLKVELTKLGIYNMFDSAPMTEAQYKEALSKFPENSLLKPIGEDYVKGTKIVGDIAFEATHIDTDVLREKASSILADLTENEDSEQIRGAGDEQHISFSDRRGIIASLAQSNFESEIQQENTVSQGRGIV